MLEGVKMQAMVGKLATSPECMCLGHEFGDEFVRAYVVIIAVYV
jgi:hypothetical protein